MGEVNNREFCRQHFSYLYPKYFQNEKTPDCSLHICTYKLHQKPKSPGCNLHSTW